VIWSEICLPLSVSCYSSRPSVSISKTSWTSYSGGVSVRTGDLLSTHYSGRLSDGKVLLVAAETCGCTRYDLTITYYVWSVETRHQRHDPGHSTWLARRPGMHPLQTGSHSTPLSAVQGSGVPGRLLYTSLRHSQPTSFTVSHSTSPNRTTLPAHNFRSSGLLGRRSNSMELATRTVSVTRRSPATASDSHWKWIYFNATMQHTAQ